MNSTPDLITTYPTLGAEAHDIYISTHSNINRIYSTIYKQSLGPSELISEVLFLADFGSNWPRFHGSEFATGGRYYAIAQVE